MTDQNEMVERVARALFADTNQDARDTWELASPVRRAVYWSNARAVIEAMREPTPDAVCRFLDARKDWAICEFNLTDWQAMIDAALGDK